MATAADVQTAYKAINRADLNAVVAQSVADAINSGATTLDAYIQTQLAATASTTQAAVAISAFITGLTPTSAKLDLLKADADKQVASYTKMGSANPQLGAFEAFGKAFAADASTGFAAKYGALSSTDFLNAVYTQVYGTQPNAAQFASLQGQIDYFVKLYTTNGFSAADAAVQAKGAVMGQIVGYAFTSSASANAVIDNQVATFLTTVAKGDATGYNAALPASTGNPGQSFTLTTGIDLLTGTVNNDTFIATTNNPGGGAPNASTATVGDSIKGGAGTDKLELTIATGTDPAPIDLDSVEQVFVRNLSNGDRDVNTSTFVGTTELWNDRSSANGTVSWTNLKAGIALGATGTNQDVDANYASAALFNGTADSQSFVLKDAGTTTSSATNDQVVFSQQTATGAIETINVVSNGASNAATLNTVAGTTTLNVSGKGALELGFAGADAALKARLDSVKTIDLSKAEGGVALLGEFGQAGDLTLTGGAGGDSATVNVAGGKATVAMGAGNDTVNIVNAGAFLATDSVKGGEGTADVVGFASGAQAQAFAALASDVRSQLSEFEIVRIGAAAADTFDISRISGANYLQVNGAVTGNTSVSGFTSGATIEMRTETSMTGGISVGMKNATDAGTPGDVLNVKLNADLTGGGATQVNLGVAGINTLNISTADRDNAATPTVGTGATGTLDGYSVALAQAADVTSIVVSGDRTLSVTGTGTVGLQTFDAAAATGNVALDLSGFTGTQGVKYTGGAAVDTFSGTRFGDDVTGGAGNDVLIGRGGADKISGGDGNDTIIGDGIDPSQQTTSASFNLGALTYEAGEQIQVNIGGTLITSAALAGGDTPATAAAALAAAINANAGLTGQGVAAIATGSNVAVSTTGAPFTVALGGGGDGVINEVAPTVEVDNYVITAGTNALSFNGVQVAISNLAAVDDIGAALVAQVTPAQLATIGATGITYNAATDTLSVTGPTTGVAINTTLTYNGTGVALAGTSVAGVATNANVVTFTNNAVGTNGADILAGGAGNDIFVYNGAQQSTVSVTDTITDLNLGSNGIGGRVDVLQLTAASGFTGGAITVANAGVAIAGVGSSLSDAVTAATATGGLLQNANTAGLLTFGSDTYLVVSDGVAATANDLVIKVTGVTGTLDASDFIA